MLRSIRNQWQPLIVAVLLCGALPAGARAQAFSFSIGSGGGHHHHHGHGPRYGCGPYWGPPWYGPAFGFAYASPPVVRDRVVYVQPPQTTVVVPQATAVAPSAVPYANSLPTNSANSAGQITIRNASGAKLPVAFLVDGQDVELADGQTRAFNGNAHNVQYDRGGRFGNTQHSLAAGNYDFRITPSGWDLVRQPDVPTIGSATVRSNSLPVQR